MKNCGLIRRRNYLSELNNDVEAKSIAEIKCSIQSLIFAISQNTLFL